MIITCGCAWTIHWFKLCLENTLVQTVHGQYTGSNCAWKIRWFKPCSIYLQSNSSGLVQRRTARIITKRKIVLKHTVNEKCTKQGNYIKRDVNDCSVSTTVLSVSRYYKHSAIFKDYTFTRSLVKWVITKLLNT